MTLKERTEAFTALGQKLDLLLSEENNQNSDFNDFLLNCYYSNKWFDKKNIRFALSQIVEMLRPEKLYKWIDAYDSSHFKKDNPRRVGVILAGNIPMVGFHDFLCILISGHIFIGKLASNDNLLMPYVADLLCGIDAHFKQFVFFKDDLREGFDAVIATGSNNSSRYFEYYFGKYPHIIRKNRNSTAVLSGNESEADLEALADDICLYYGKGCRSVSKIFIPQNYNFEKLFHALKKYEHFSNSSKYFNNYEYYKSIFIINNTAFKDNGFIILKEQEGFNSPVSILYYEYYENIKDVNNIIAENQMNIQCVVSTVESISNKIDFGFSQKPDLWEYSDNVDTLDFLSKL